MRGCFSGGAEKRPHVFRSSQRFLKTPCLTHRVRANKAGFVHKAKRCRSRRFPSFKGKNRMSDKPPEPSEENLTAEFTAFGQEPGPSLANGLGKPGAETTANGDRKRAERAGPHPPEETEAFRESPTGQRIQTDVENIKESVRTGEAENARALGTALRPATGQHRTGKSCPALGAKRNQTVPVTAPGTASRAPPPEPPKPPAKAI